MKRTVIECDVCGCEIDESILIPNIIPIIDIVEINLEINDDICIYCFIKAVNRLDKRSKAA